MLIKKDKHLGQRGFTVVELMVVVVAIAILAAIVLVGYNSVQKNALNVHKMAALSDWRELFQLYAAKNGGKHIEVANPNGPYCLGREFMHQACWNVYDVYGNSDVVGAGPKPWEPVAYENESMMVELETVGVLPEKSTCIVDWYCPTTEADGVGPMVTYIDGKPAFVWDFFFGSKCPGNVTPAWTDGNAATCELRI